MPVAAVASDIASIVSAVFRAVARDKSSCVKEGCAPLAGAAPVCLHLLCRYERRVARPGLATLSEIARWGFKGWGLVKEVADQI